MKIKENENNYVIDELELTAIVHLLNMWRHYLMGRKFDLIIDHSGLKYLFQKQFGWNFLADVTFTLNILEENRTRLLKHSTKEYKQCMLHPFVCENLI